MRPASPTPLGKHLSLHAASRVEYLSAMIRSRSTVIALLFCAAVNAAVGSAARADEAADAYRAAFALLPTDHASFMAGENWDGPIDLTAIAMVDKSGPALEGLHKASAAKFESWNRDYSQGMDTPVPEYSKARKMSQVAGVKIRILCQAKKYDQAATLVLDTIIMGRRIAADKGTNALDIDYGIERKATSAFAETVPSMPAETLRKLAEAYAAIPPAGSFADAVNHDKELVLTTMRKPYEKHNPMGDMLPANDSERAALTKEVEALSTKLAEVIALPPDKQYAGCADYDDLAKGMSPSTRKIVPKPAELLAELQAGAEHEPLFITGLYVAADGEGALQSHLDPLTNKPFEYKKDKSGGAFGLRSSMVVGKSRPEIAFGPDALK
jgi:hypothetical protein